MFLNGEMEVKLDHAVFADTQEEPEAVYRHLEWLCSLGGPPILTASSGKLGDDLIHGKNSTGQRFASIPAFTSATPGVTGGMLRRQCTAEYKINVVERIIRRQVVGPEYRQPMSKGVKVVQNFGLSFDEPRRVARVKARFVGHPWAVGRGPFPAVRVEDDHGRLRGLLEGAADPARVGRSADIALKALGVGQDHLAISGHRTGSGRRDTKAGLLMFVARSDTEGAATSSGAVRRDGRAGLPAEEFSQPVFGTAADSR